MIPYAIIIQARMGSSRLPEKVMLPFFQNQSLLETLIQRISKCSCPIIVATSTSSQDDPIANLCHQLGCLLFRGSESNVLSRFIAAAEAHQVKYIIRVCADNPFLDLNAINQLIEGMLTNYVDYWAYYINEDQPSIKSHFGFWPEGVTTSALKKISASPTLSPRHIEHVTNFIYETPELFRIHKEIVTSSIGNRTDIRLTVDNSEDFLTAQEIYQHFMKSAIPIDIAHVINFLDHNPEHLQAMRERIHHNPK